MAQRGSKPMLGVCRGILAVIALIAIGSRGLAADAEAVPANTVITLQRGACEKRCAVYKIVLFGDGTVIYDGQHYVRKSGIASAKVGAAAIADLVARFDAANYFELGDDYGYNDSGTCESLLSDAPIAMTSIVTGAKAKAIIHHHRCVGPISRKLGELETKIDEVAGSVRWIK